jgi:SAM-dependent methyltransferase
VEQLTQCNLCDGSRFSLFAELPGHATSHTFRVMTCDACGLRFISPRLTADENRALYTEAYFNGEGFDTSVNYVLLEDEDTGARHDENEGTLEKIALFKTARDIRVLDVGCGTGGFLKALGGAGYTDVWGIEFSDYAASLARERTGARVLVGDILDAELPEGTFDVINATEVIEHLRDPKRFFARVHALLAPGGVFLYSTGNARGLYARVLGKRWPYLHPEGHLFYYDPSTLARYFADAGLTSVAASQLAEPKRSALIRAEGRIARAILLYVGQSDRGLKGRIFRLAASVDTPFVRRAITRVLGRETMPIAMKPVANAAKP